ncbi:unnamed protein product [Periconia digitata]|uniref:Uncharacterized protein n=1 Tax=Periconia digitata TaxID=1303443 RepID=A0A9W4ULZ9_9PLEO|nr:unnamed protein product [Periconia digitata]
MSAANCCSIFEKEIVSRLLRPHKRADNHLTPTETDRLTNTFTQVWGLLWKPQKEKERGLERMSLKEIFCIRQLTMFLFGAVDVDDLQKIADEDTPWDSSKCFASLEEILVSSGNRLQRDLDRWYDTPDRAPLTIFAFFDHWQEVWMEQFD